MYYAGIDAHKNYLTIAIVDNQGELVSEEGRVPIGDGEPLVAALEGPRPLDAVVESCPFWPWIHDTLQPTEVGFHLANANRLEAIASSETKTDSVDAELLARMLGGGLIPEVYPKPPRQRDLCRLIRHREALVRERTSLLNRIHGHLQQQGLQLGREKLRTDEGRTWLREEAWPWLSPEQKALIEGHQELITELSDQIEELDGRIRDEAQERPPAQLLQTVPGIGTFRSVLLVAEVSPIERFPSPAELVSFAGLAPTTSDSGKGEAVHGPIPQGANRRVRGALVSAIPSHMQSTPESSLGQYYRRKQEQLGMPTARIAAARKLCRAIHAMLSTGEVWRG
ncbi:MAG: IS110 family transposase [Candidatus Palauibacterales bacterium]|nr:IS110 family transposase [Candidatus Palauibacterales bacterium]